MKKVYALYHNKEKQEMSIKSPAYFQKESLGKALEDSDSSVAFYNHNIFLSFSRAELRKTANEIKARWQEETEAMLEKIKNIKI